MADELPFFALNVVVFPGEKLNMHVFEPQYKALINDSLSGKGLFGIPASVTNQIEYGTKVKITELVKKYDDGRMDIRVEGKKPFHVLEYENPWKEYDYGGGTVEYIKTEQDADTDLNLDLIELCRELYEWLGMKPDFDFFDDNILYDVVHKVGLKPVEEYKLLQMRSQLNQQKYVIKHLKKLIPALERAEKARERIRMNGNFQNLDPFKF